MNTASSKLISKELLPRNFKLVFSNKPDKKFFLILHGSQKKIFSSLVIGEVYSFSWSKGKNDQYTFLKPYSIKLVEPSKFEKTFFRNLRTELKLRNFNHENIAKNLEKLRQENKNNNQIFFSQAIQAIQLLILKHQELSKTPQRVWNDEEQKQKEKLEQLRLLFLLKE